MHPEVQFLYFILFLFYFINFFIYCFGLVFFIDYKVEYALRRGAVLLTWSSTLLDKFFKDVDTAVLELKHVVKQVCC